MKKLALWFVALMLPLGGWTTTITKPTHITINNAGGACPQTAGTLTLSALMPRSSGISPLTVFINATATTDSSVAAPFVPFQDVNFSTNFKDTGTSGTGTWAYGSNGTANGGTGNSRNIATGGVAAHVYIIPDGQGDTTFTPVITATKGSNTVSCSLPTVTVFDPTGVNGFVAANTTCYFNSAVGSGCPAGATQTTTSVFSQTNGTLSNKRLLYKCGDTFTGNANTIAGSKISIGAYGGCQQTKVNRPIFSDTLTGHHLDIARTVSDLRISDIDCESSNTSAACIGDPGGSFSAFTQVTLVNIKSAGNSNGVSTFQGSQFGMFDSEITSGVTSIALHVNDGENNCVNASTAFNCGGTPSYLNINYQAVVGTHVKGIGAGGGGGTETLRVEAWRFLYVADNDLGDSNNVGSPLKIHSGNTNNSLATWIGQYGEYGEFSDNYYFGNGGGAGCQEIAPQNGGLDERIRFVVIERDLCAVNAAGQGQRFAMLSAQNLTMRDSVYLMAGNASLYANTGPQFITRGNGNFPAWQSINNEAFNISCNITTSPAQNGQECVGFDGVGGFTAVASSVAKNVMVFSGAASGRPAVTNTGTANTVSNNTATSTNNPGFTDASGTFKLITDWKPTANFTGGATVPSLYDALGVAWAGTWDLGAVKH